MIIHLNDSYLMKNNIKRNQQNRKKTSLYRNVKLKQTFPKLYFPILGRRGHVPNIVGFKNSPYFRTKGP